MGTERNQDDYVSLVRTLVAAKQGDNRQRLWRARGLDASAWIAGGVIAVFAESGWLGLFVTVALFVLARTQWTYPTLLGWFVIFGIAEGLASWTRPWP